MGEKTMKKNKIIIACGLVAIGLILGSLATFIIMSNSSSSSKEDALIGLKYVNSSNSNGKYVIHWEFNEANVIYSYQTNCSSLNKGPKCNEGTENYEIDEDGILIVTSGDYSSKWKISEDYSTITEIGTGTVMTREN